MGKGMTTTRRWMAPEAVEHASAGIHHIAAFGVASVQSRHDQATMCGAVQPCPASNSSSRCWHKLHLLL